MLGWGGTALQKDSVGTLKGWGGTLGEGTEKVQQVPGKEASEEGCMFDGQCFFFFSHLKSGTSNVNKAEDAGKTHPFSALTREAFLS